jgi:DNA-binding transcriptional regulator PaaX
MLPEAWAGFDVHELVSQMYGVLAVPSNRYITQTLKNADGLLPEEDPLFWQRFRN